MKKAIITLPESTKDRDSLFMKRYQFVDGKMSVPILSDNCTDHQKIGGLLSKYYGCTVEIVEGEGDEDDSEALTDQKTPKTDPDLAKAATSTTAKTATKSTQA